METGAIITGDIVESNKFGLVERRGMLDVIESIPELLSGVEPNSIMEIFRGDGFQIRIPNATVGMLCAITVRAWLRSHKVGADSRPLDARLGVGIGRREFETKDLATSDGEAYRLSGRLLDNLHKGRLAVITPWHEINEELKLSTAFADDIVSSWTVRQSSVILQALLARGSHGLITQELGVTKQMLDKTLKSAKEPLIKAYIHRYEELIKRQLLQNNGNCNLQMTILE